MTTGIHDETVVMNKPIMFCVTVVSHVLLLIPLFIARKGLILEDRLSSTEYNHSISQQENNRYPLLLEVSLFIIHGMHRRPASKWALKGTLLTLKML